MVAGIKVNIDLPDSWLDVGGWVYVSGKPIVYNDGATIKLDEVSFTRELDNELWSTVSVILSETIRETIEKSAIYDLSQDIEKAKASLSKALSQVKSGVSINIGNPHIALGRTSISGNTIFVEGRFESKAELTLAKLP